MINQSTKPKARKEKPALKVTHRIDTDKDGKNATISSTVSNPPKLREAVGMGPKPVKTEKAKAESKDVSKTNGIGDFDYKVLHALNTLGGKDVDSMTLAKKTGTTHSHPDAPRAPIRHAMQAFEEMGYVKAEKKGAKYLFSITEQGKKAALTTEGKDKPIKDTVPNKAKEAGGDPLPKPSSNERPANTDIQCQACKTWNPYVAIHCKECGAQLKVETVVKAAPIAA